MLTFNRGELAAINEKLKTLAAKAGKTAIRQAARKAMVPVRDGVRANAPEDTSEPDSIRVKSNVALYTRWKGSELRVRIGIKGGAQKNEETPFYWRFHEFGTKTLPARPFMEPALEANAQQVLDTVADELKKALEL